MNDIQKEIAEFEKRLAQDEFVDDVDMVGFDTTVDEVDIVDEDDLVMDEGLDDVMIEDEVLAADEELDIDIDEGEIDAADELPEDDFEGVQDAVGYKRRLAKASVMLDRVANYLEQKAKDTGDKKYAKYAYEVDEIADEVDSRLSNIDS